MRLLIGFSVDTSSTESVETILGQMLKAGCRAIELHPHAKDGHYKLPPPNQLALIKDFEYRSVHLPALQSQATDEEVIDELLQIAEAIDAVGLTLHPDRLDEHNWPTQVFGSRLGIENMDWRKIFGKSVEDLEKVFLAAPSAKWVYDPNHVKTNDTSMKLGDDLYKAFSSRLLHYHLSGFGGKDLPHTLLADTHQTEIIKRVTDRTKPIIIESFGPDGFDRLQEELDYIVKSLC